MISHEIRTPINGLLGTLSLLEDSQLDDPQRELLEVAVMSGENLRQLLNDVIDFAQLETGNIQLEPSPFSMRKLAQRLIEFWQPQARTRGNSMVLNVADEVPEVLMGDTGRFGQVLNNLVSNAIKFTTDGSIAVVIRVDQDAAPEPSRCSLKIEVVDTGLGIARRDIPNLFKEFSQVVETSNDDRTRSFDSVVSQRGSGLGLAICRSLVARRSRGIPGQPAASRCRWFPVGSGWTFLTVSRLSGPTFLAVSRRSGPVGGFPLRRGGKSRPSPRTAQAENLIVFRDL